MTENLRSYKQILLGRVYRPTGACGAQHTSVMLWHAGAYRPTVCDFESSINRVVIGEKALEGES